MRHTTPILRVSDQEAVALSEIIALGALMSDGLVDVLPTLRDRDLIEPYVGPWGYAWSVTPLGEVAASHADIAGALDRLAWCLPDATATSAGCVQ